MDQENPMEQQNKNKEGSQEPLPAGLNRWLLNNILTLLAEQKEKVDAMYQHYLDRTGGES